MVIGGNKFFRANDSRIRKIACPVLKAVDSGDFKRFFSLFFHHRRFNDIALTDLRAVYRTGFVHISSITLQPFIKLKFMS